MKIDVSSNEFPDPVVLQAALAIVTNRDRQAVNNAIASGKIDYVGPDGDTLVTVAVLSNNAKALQFLIANGANPDLPAQNAPIAYAAGGASVDIIRTLLDARCNPDGKVGSQSALWRASQAGRIDVAKLLLNAGANIDLADANGDVPMTTAVRAGEFELATFLLQAGASTFTHDKLGRTPAFWVNFARMDPTSEKGRARDRLIQALKDRGHPWPPPGPEEVLAMKAAGQWPPRQ